MKHIERLFLIAVFTCFLSCSSVNAQDSGLIKLMVNDEVFDVQLENNSATEELIKILKKIISLSMHPIMAILKRWVI